MECLKDRFDGGVVLDGRFETISPLNNGSFGMVFMAKDLETNEFVAIKCLTKRSADVDSSFAIDERSEELECHARLGLHPNIVNLIHSFETEAHIYIVLEFCSRGDLYEAIRNESGPTETESVRQFMLQLVDAVAYIHSKGMYHRDIKPENIFLTESGEMKLGDFGLATSDPWTYETAVGSDRYMSPEQYDSAGAGYAPHKADIWAIGICLLNILFRRNPFITPTEDDPLFLDFSRDNQSLFDVFPKMSQDTYEVIAQCMSLDPRKRSLEGVREALQRAVSFTICDEPIDTFSSVERQGVTNTNREPLRTPSIQSPQLDNGSFPWARALHASPPQQMRQLSAIPDDESYVSEDLFPSSHDISNDWFSVGQHTPSLASMLDSSLGSSLKPIAAKRVFNAAESKGNHFVSGSLPVTISRPKPIPSMSSVFGKKEETVSKSWNDIWDEDQDEVETDSQLKARQEMNSRTWSHESTTGDDTVRVEEFKISDEPFIVDIENTTGPAGTTTANHIDEDLVADGFFFHDIPKEIATPVKSPRYSPPSKRTTFDKWSQLGERRRAYTGTSEAEKSPELWKGPRRNVGLGFTGFGHGFWDMRANTVLKDTFGFKDRGASKGTCPWARESARSPRRNSSGKYRRHGSSGSSGDLEWVGGFAENLHL